MMPPRGGLTASRLLFENSRKGEEERRRNARKEPVSRPEIVIVKFRRAVAFSRGAPRHPLAG